MIEWSEDETLLCDELLWQYHCEENRSSQRDRFLERWPYPAKRELFLVEMIRCDFVDTHGDLDWLARELPLLQQEPARIALLRGSFLDLSELGVQASWSDYQRFAYPADCLRLAMEGDPAYVGQVLDDAFLLERKLGDGGFAVVYQGRSKSEGNVAVKVLRKAFSTATTPARRYFLREAIRTASLPASPGLPELFDVRITQAERQEILYAVYRLAEGKSLTSWMQHHPSLANPLWVARTVRAAADLLTLLHAHGLYHGDLSPANIMVADNGTVHLIDLGLSLQEHECRTWVRTGGTTGFTPPEVIDQHRYYGTSSEIYSLGRVLSNLLASLPTQAREQVSSAAINDLQAISSKACTHQPEDRFANAVQFSEALSHWIGANSNDKKSLRISLGEPNRGPAFSDWDALAEFTRRLNQDVDPTRTPENLQRLQQARQTDFTQALALLEGLEEFRHGTALVIPLSSDGYEYRFDVARLLWAVATYLRLQCQASRSLMYAERALEFGTKCGIAERFAGEFSLWLDDTAVLLKDHGRHQEAVAAAHECLRLRLQLPASDAIFIHQAHNNFGEILRASGDRTRASRHLKQFRHFVRAELGPNDNEYGWALSNKSQNALDDGQLEAANALAAQALAIKNQTLGCDHVQLTFVHNKLGKIATMLHEFENADRYFERAVSIREEHYGACHSVTQKSRNLWTESLIARKDYEGAFRLCAAGLEALVFDSAQADYCEALRLGVKLSHQLGFTTTCRRYRAWLEGIQTQLHSELFAYNTDTVT